MCFRLSARISGKTAHELRCRSMLCRMRPRRGCLLRPKRLDVHGAPGRGNACLPRDVCVQSSCAIDCPPSQARCKTAGGDVCVDLSTNPAYCGSCSTPCVVGPHAAPTCTLATCGLTCDPGYPDCDGMPGDGCEVDTGTDAANCGGCGKGRRWRPTPPRTAPRAAPARRGPRPRRRAPSRS